MAMQKRLSFQSATAFFVCVMIVFCGVIYAEGYVKICRSRLNSWGDIGQNETIDFGKHDTWKVPILYIKDSKLIARARCSERPSACRIRIKVYKKNSLKADGWGKVTFRCDGQTSKNDMWYLILTSPNCKHECDVSVRDR